MSRPEDRGSHDVASAAAYERWRSQDDAPDHDEGYSRSSRARARDYCRCHSASEEPCDYCSREPEPEPCVCATCGGDRETCPTCKHRNQDCDCPATEAAPYGALVDCPECEGRGWTE